MPFHLRPRWLARAALAVVVAAGVAACAQGHPDSIFHGRTDFNRDVDHLFKILIYAGVIVFVLVEAVLVWALIRFRQRPGQPEPEHVHGNTTLEIAWTVIPALILILIAIPTVSSIFRTQAVARADALQVEVIGHQWWWEFKYPQYGVETANELYLPIGRTVNFTLHSKDVIHSFWIPSLGGKRDVIANRTNYLWFTPDSSGANVWNGACVEYCGASHANMRFKAFTVNPADFASWIANQQAPAVGATAAPTTAPTPTAPAARGAAPTAALPGVAAPAGVTPTVGIRPPPVPSGAAAAAVTAPAQGQSPTSVAQAGFIAFPRERIPAHAVPQTPLPVDLPFDENLKGDAKNGATLMATVGTCLACHTIKGSPMMLGVIGPNLTHVASRTTIAAGLYPNDARHLARWIKNAPHMKPGVVMPTLGVGQINPLTGKPITVGLNDQQIADIVAYLQTLK